MPDMNLAAVMKLDSAGMTGPLSAIQGQMAGVVGKLAAVAGGVLSVSAVFNGLRDSLNLGGQLAELSDRTGIAVKDLVVLRQAFDDTGVGAENGVNSLMLMQRALAGMNDEGEPTNKMFKQLGLNMDDLKKLSTQDQLTTIGQKIRGLKDPAEQTAAAMAIFGRSGAAMKQFFADPAAIDTARRSLGSMPDILDKNARLFDEIGDAVGRVKTKITGFWAGVLEGMAPALKGISDSLDTIDFAAMGKKAGEFIATLITAFKEGKLGEIVALSLKIGFSDAANFLAGAIGSANFWTGIAQIALAAFMGIGSALLKVFMGPITYLQAGMDMVFANMGTTLSKVLIGAISPLVAILDTMFGGKISGMMKEAIEKIGVKDQGLTWDAALKAAQTQPFFLKTAAEESGKMSSEMMAKGLANVGDFKSANIFGDPADRANLEELWASMSEKSKATLAAVQDAANKTAPLGTESLAAPEGKAKKIQETKLDVATDRWAKLGLFIGGNSPQLDHSKRTAAATEKTAHLLDVIKDKLTTPNTQTLAWAN